MTNARFGGNQRRRETRPREKNAGKHGRNYLSEGGATIGGPRDCARRRADAADETPKAGGVEWSSTGSRQSKSVAKPAAAAFTQFHHRPRGVVTHAHFTTVPVSLTPRERGRLQRHPRARRSCRAVELHDGARLDLKGVRNWLSGSLPPSGLPRQGPRTPLTAAADP